MKIKALTAFVILIMLVSAIPTPVQSLGTSVLPADQANNNRASCPYIEIEENEYLDVTRASKAPLPDGNPYGIVHVNFGKPEDFSSVDVNGKIALIRRGENSFEEKGDNAAAAGAVAIIVYNTDDDVIEMGGTFTIPAFMVSISLGEEIIIRLQIDANLQVTMGVKAVAFSGNGTEASPYLIQSARDLEQLATLINNEDYNTGYYYECHYRLTRDIDLSSYNWSPIGIGIVEFEGVFDGDMHTIYNLTIHKEAKSPADTYGLFGSNRGVIRNIRLVGTNIYITAGYLRGAFVGGISGINSRRITNCSNHGYIQASSGEGSCWCGGIVGRNFRTIDNCYNTADVKSILLSGTGYDINAGGIAGGIRQSDSQVTDCYNTGAIYASGFSRFAYAGGIMSGGKTVKTSYNIGMVHGKGNIGGVVGELSSSGSIEWAYFANTFSRGVGDGDDSGTYRRTILEMQQQSTFEGFDFENIWIIDPASGYPYPQLRSNPHVIVEKKDKLAVKTIIVYERIGERDVPVSGARIQIGSRSYTTNSQGVATVKPGDNFNDIFISKDGYSTTSLTAEEYFSAPQTLTVRLFPEPQSISIKSVYVSTDFEGSKGKNVLLQQFSVEEGSSSTHYIKALVDCLDNLFVKRVYLKQGTTEVELSKSSLYIGQLGKEFKANEPILITAVGSDGSSVTNMLKIRIKERNDEPAVTIGAPPRIEGTASGPYVKILGYEIPLFVFPTGIELTSIGGKHRLTWDEQEQKFVGVIGLSDESISENTVVSTARAIKNLFKNSTIRASARKELWKIAKKQSGKMGIKSDYKVLGYIEAKYIDGKLKLTKGEVVFQIEAGVSGTNYLNATPPIYIHYSLTAGANVAGKLSLEDDHDTFVVHANLYIKPGIGAGLGVKKMASVEAGVKGKINARITTDSGDDPLRITGELATYLIVELGFWKVLDLRWKFPDYQFFPRSDYSSDPQMIFDFSQAQLASRDYLQQTSRFVANDHTMDAGAATSTSVFLGNTYPRTQSQLVSLGDGRQLLVWVHDDGVRDSLNRTALYYSVYDGFLWSQPAHVSDDGTADLMPQLAVAEDSVYLVWQNSNQVMTEETSLEDFLASLDIACARFDGTEFVDVVHISQEGLDSDPAVAIEGAEVSVTWINNDESSSMGTEGNNTIYRVFFDGTVWSTPDAIAENINSVASLSAGYVGGQHVVALSVDMDNDLSDYTDREIYLYKDEILQRITDNAVLDSNPVISCSQLYWYSGGTISYIKDLDDSLYVIETVGTDVYLDQDNFIVLTNEIGQVRLVWSQDDEMTAELWSIAFNQVHQNWEKPIQVTYEGEKITGFSGFLDEEGQLYVAFARTPHSITDTSIVIGMTDLCLLHQGNCFNISLGEVTYTSGDVIPGSSIQLDFPISNLGTEPIESVYIEVLNSEDEVLHSFNIYQNLLPGETMAAYVMYNLPDSVETLANHTVRVMVTIPEQEDVDTMDNFREINIERNTVLIDEVNVFKFGETYQVTANVANYGFTSVANLVLSLSKDSETGDLLAQETIDSLDAWDMQAVTFTLSAETLGINDEKSETLLYMSLTREDSYQDSDYFVIEDRFDFIPVTSITVSAGATEITTESGTLQMHARVEPENATNKSVIWSLSCGSEYATITETGLLTAIDNGVVTVRATATDSSNVYGETQIAISGQPVTSIAQPVISVEPDLDTYLPCAITVTISCSTPGVNIYYTTDGSLPTSSTGLLFTGPFSLTPGTTKATERIICAVAVKAGIPDSTISTRTVSFLDAMHRVAGSNRYATAAAIGKEGWDSSTTVVLARGDNSADALAGVPLAFAYNAPILLTSTYRLSAVTREEIIRLGASKVIILGGEGAVSESVAQVLRGELHVEVERVSGKNRFATAAEVAKKLTDISGSAHKAILAYGLDFPDALASASYAAMAGYPILLVRTDRLTEDTKAVIAELNIQDFILVGGSGVISDELMSQLSSAVRISGSNRYSTAVELAKYFAPASSGVYFATGLDFADAITGCVLAAKNNSGLLLVHPDRAFASVQDYIVESGCMWATVFGGTGAVNDDVASIIEELIGRQYAAKAQVAIR